MALSCSHLLVCIDADPAMNTLAKNRPPWAMVSLAVLTVATGPLLLLSWSLFYSGPCVVLVIPVLVALLLTLAARDQLRQRRRCVADCYFVAGTLLHRLVSSTKLVTLLSLAVSLGLTTVLLVSVPTWGMAVMVLLTLDAVLIALLYFGLFRAASGGLRVRGAFRFLFARRWAVMVNLPLVLVALLWLQLQQPPPAWLDGSLDLETTLRAASESVGSDCPLVDSAVRLNSEKDAFAWWLTLKGTAALEDSRLRWAAWLVFLLSGTLALWAYSRLCVYLISSAHRWALPATDEQCNEC